MKNSVTDLKPKANKLLSFIINWRLAKPCKNIELAQAIQELITTGEFPPAITAFFKFAQFKKLLKTMEKGKLFDPAIWKKSNDEDHLLEEIHNLQILIEAFHKLIHLDYNQEDILDPNVHVKVLSKNISEYLLCSELFIPYEGKIVDEILTLLFKNIHGFSQKIQKIILDNPNLFTHEMIKLTHGSIFKLLSQLSITNYDSTLNEKWLKVMIELNLESKLDLGLNQMTSLGKANAHKLINQMQSLLDKQRQFYQQNLPYFVPFSLRKKILNEFEDKKKTEKILGQKVNELFYAHFDERRYSVIEAKEHALANKASSIHEELHLSKESLFSLVDQYHIFLPDKFSNYVINMQKNLSANTSILGNLNYLAVQFELGYHSIQNDYLIELLNAAPTGTNLPSDFSLDEIYLLLPVICLFLESYYSRKPLTSFKTIKKLLIQLYQNEEAFKEHRISKVTEKIENTFNLIIPNRSEPLDKLEAIYNAMVKMIEQLLPKLPKTTIEHQLLKERIRDLHQVDLPSYPQTWFVIGEILGFLFIILSNHEKDFSKKLSSLKESISSYPFINTLIV